MTAAAAPSARPARSVFTGADVCALAGLSLPGGSARPMFDDQMWDFTDVMGLPVQMQPAHRRFDFTAILDPGWRLVARELIMALLAPRHAAVAPLPRAYRTPLHLNTARGRLAELTRWLNWLTEREITGLGQVGEDTCQEYLAERRHVRDAHGTVIGDQSPATRRAAAQVVVDLLSYGELLAADRLDPRLRPWGGASASAVAQVRCGRDGNTTPPVADAVLQPLLAAALYLVTALGPHVAVLHEQIRQAGTVRSRISKPAGTRARPADPAAALTTELDRHRCSGQPLPELDAASQRDRIVHGWDPADPLLAVSLDAIARQAGYVHFEARWLPRMRDDIHTVLQAVGTDRPWARAAEQVTSADGQ